MAWARWVWGSIPPGTTILPAASITRAPSRGSEPGRPTRDDLLALDADLPGAGALGSHDLSVGDHGV